MPISSSQDDIYLPMMVIKYLGFAKIRFRLLWTQWNKSQIFDLYRIRWNVLRRYRLSETVIASFRLAWRVLQNPTILAILKKRAGFSEVTGACGEPWPSRKGAVFS
ncbi:MAG TPA: hypothetical protein VMW42_00310 [Desulfatiglandales bacterium]|nr:hypothetical protein [Desulfatiglandales bacterium]